MSDGGEEALLSDRERSHLSRRDRKRETRMVLDNAGVKRVQPSVAQRRKSKLKTAKRRG